MRRISITAGLLACLAACGERVLPGAGQPVDDAGWAMPGDGGADDAGAVLDAGPGNAGSEDAGFRGAPHCRCAAEVTVPLGIPVPLLAQCTDPEREPLTYQWTIESRPAGSMEAIVDPSSATTAFTPLQFTLGNPYVIGLRVTDARGDAAACAQRIHVAPIERLYVQASWDACRVTQFPAAEQLRTVTQGCGGF